MLITGLADYLGDTIPGVEWHNDGTPYDGTNYGVYLWKVPHDQPKAIALYEIPGEQSSPRLGYDQPSVQIRVRGNVNAIEASNMAWAIYNQLHGLSAITFSDGTYVTVAVCEQSGPIFFQFDTNERPQFTINVRFNIRNPTIHREAPIV